MLSLLVIGVCLCAFWLYRTHEAIKTVLQYRATVRKVLKDNDSKVNEDLVLAVIYTETKGNSQDLMQSSESSSGTTNSITDSKTSIQQGITVLGENLDQAQDKHVDAWTAVQAYNFGMNYINYVAENGGKNTIALAKRYSKNVVAPSLGNTTGKTYFYLHPIALFYGGGELYENGGNIYYSRQVQFNYHLIKLMTLF
nr:lysozyme family protein [Streptococcus sp. DD12]